MAFVWRAVYRDGTVVDQHDRVSGKELSTDHLDRERLSALMVLDHDQKRVLLAQHYGPGQKPIFRRRVLNQSGTERVCYLLGWRRGDGGEGERHIAYVFEEDGHIECSSHFHHHHTWFYSPAWTSYDEGCVGEAEVLESPISDVDQSGDLAELLYP